MIHAFQRQDGPDTWERIMNKRGRTVETKEYIGMLRRSLRALSARVGEQADVELLTDMLKLQADYDRAVTLAVAGLRRQYSWQEIAERAGITRQTAHQRWAKKIEELENARA